MQLKMDKGGIALLYSQSWEHSRSTATVNTNTYRDDNYLGVLPLLRCPYSKFEMMVKVRNGSGRLVGVRLVGRAGASYRGVFMFSCPIRPPPPAALSAVRVGAEAYRSCHAKEISTGPAGSAYRVI